ncbi:MAG TPA: M48 family metallopeptidase [Ktedonobacteraceae bacterium]|nr:M48 family metallopeptidase [Ktedonobacteraceae bacterium]
MSTAQPNLRQRFPGIDPIALQHPYDRAALGALQRVPGLDIVVRKFIELFPEKVAYIQNVAQSVRVSSTQCPQLYASLQEACAILDMPEPELYALQSPVPNAYTSGCERPYIVVTTGLLDLLTETEVLGVIAHELGHIKSGHVLYKTMARCISLLLTIIGGMTLGLGSLIGRSLEAALLEWDRKSEFTADRAGSLVVQDSEVVLSLMMKLAGGTLFQRDQMNAREFLKQADLYEEVDANLLDRMYKLLLVSAVSHPLIIVRARESVNWSEGQQYKDILAGRYPRVPTYGSNGRGTGSNGRGTGTGPTSSTPSGTPTPSPSSEPRVFRCPHCDREQANQRFCSFCGGAIE